MSYYYKLLDAAAVNDRLTQLRDAIMDHCPFATVVSESSTQVIINFQAGHYLRIFVSGAGILGRIRNIANSADFETNSFSAMSFDQNNYASMVYGTKSFSLGNGNADHYFYVVKTLDEGYLMHHRSQYTGLCSTINPSADTFASRLVAFSNPTQQMHDSTDVLVTPVYYTDLTTGKLREFDGCVYSAYLPAGSTGIHIDSSGQAYGATASGTNRILVKG